MVLFNQMIRELHKYPSSKLDILVYYGLGEHSKLHQIRNIDDFLLSHQADRIKILCKYSGKSYIVSRLNFDEYRLATSTLDIFQKEGNRIRVEF
ncbi:MAG: hypothetical protein WBH44_04155 [Proteocatella sp.]